MGGRLTSVIMVDEMSAMHEGSGRVVRQAPVPWRSTLRGVLVLADDALLLEGLAATVWIALDGGPLDEAALLDVLAGWDLDVEAGPLDQALTYLVDLGLLVS